MTMSSTDSDPADADPAATVLDIYQHHVTAFVALRSTALFERPWLDALLAAMPPGGREVLDIGCGTGAPMAAYLIAKGCHVTGIDGAPAMIERARASFPGHVWISADMRELPELGAFHAVVAWHSFFHLTPEDQRPMFARFGRHCLPGGVLIFTSGTAHGEAIGSFEGRPLYHGSLDSAEYHDLLRANGFDVIRHVETDPDCGGATVWLARKSGGQGD